MIQTVNGKITKKDMKRGLVHEHISCASNHMLKAFGNDWLNREHLTEYASDVLKAAKERYNVNLFVDGTVQELGRDAGLLKEISQKSGVNIVASAGFYLFHDFGIDGLSYTELADLLLRECELGMDGTDVKPGILKCAASRNELTDEIVKKHASVGTVQKKTGLPVYVHCEHTGSIVFEQIDELVRYGADTSRIIIGHCAKQHGFDYIKSILKRGCYISMDQCIFFPDELPTIANCIVKACADGYGDKVLFSNDYCIYSDFQPRNRNGFHLSTTEQVEKLGYVFDVIYKEFVKHGGKHEDWENITMKNVCNALDVF